MQKLPTKQITFSPDSQEILLKGAEKLYRAVASTLGPKGRNVVIEATYGTPLVTKDGVTVAKHTVLPNPQENLGAEIIKQAALKTLEKAGDGPQPLHAKILTPNGFTTMGQIKKGDIICAPDQTTQIVEEVYDKGDLQIYKVTLSDGRVVECSSNHLWNVITSYGSSKVLTTEEILKTGKVKSMSPAGDSIHGFYLPKAKIHLAEKPITIDPYLLGLLIGDGSLSGTGEIELSLGLNKEHIISKLPTNLKFTVAFKERKNYFRIKFKDSFLKEQLKELGLYGTKSSTKFIPYSYLFNSEEIRRGLLQGLLDTDGYLNKKGLFEFSTVSHQLAKDFKTLVWSLGYDVHHYLRQRDNDKDSYSNIPIHRVSQLKGYKYGIKIIDITATDTFFPMKCIKVSHPSHLYITDNFIVTHNTTTSTVLAYHLFKNGKDLLSKYSPIEIKRLYDEATDKVTQELVSTSKKVTIDNIYDIAKISANNDSKIAQLIQQGYQHVGLDGIIAMEDSQTTSTTISTIDGVSIPASYISPYFITNQSKQEVVYEKPLILITDIKITRNEQVIPALEIANQQKRPLVIIADDIDQHALTLLILNKVRANFPVVAIKAPAYAERRQAILNDLSALTSSKLVSNADQGLLENVTLEDLGTCDKITVDKDSTILQNPTIDPVRVQERKQQIQDQLLIETNEFLKEKLEQRYGFLSTKIAVMYVGAPTEAEQKEIKARIDDALKATRCAIAQGYTKGAGVALIEACHVLPDDNEIYQAYTQALLCPNRKIVQNAGFDGNSAITNMNILTNEEVDLIQAGIIDPTLVLLEALKNANSAATMLLLSDTLINNIDQDFYNPHQNVEEFQTLNAE